MSTPTNVQANNADAAPPAGSSPWDAVIEAVMDSLDASQAQLPAIASLVNVLKNEFTELQTSYWGPNGSITQKSADINDFLNNEKGGSSPSSKDQQKFQNMNNQYNNLMSEWNLNEQLDTTPINQADSLASSGLTSFQSQVSQLQQAIQGIGNAYNSITQGG
ncbi:MAG: hypothetical protein K2P51_05790 [Rhabdochlamydiaceae bacterium]|nr:hypothetical protein [Rhabdochlamydiaceae bacterium]